MSEHTRKATAAQAKRLARIWGDAGEVTSPDPAGSGYVEPTTRALIRRGWLYPVGPGKPYPNGLPTWVWRVSDNGLTALAEFLRYGRAGTTHE